ncbi:hypothetical protein RVW00_000175 [Enterobacter bugandensis]|nr:hypothetical protein [Enterobacter bugandensis]
MKIYIGNCSHQTLGLFFRLPESSNFVNHDIPKGGQIVLDLTAGDIDALVKHLRLYGARETKETEKKFSGTLYCVGKEITASAMEKGYRQMIGSLQVMSEELAKVNAVVIDKAIEDTEAVQQGLANKTDVEVEVEASSVDPVNDSSKTVNKTVVKK